MNLKVQFVLACSCLVTGISLAAEQVQEMKVISSNVYKGSPTAMRSKRDAFEAKHFGGRLCKPESAKGKVVFLNAQKIVSEKEISTALDVIVSRFNIQLELLNVEKVNFINPSKDIASTGTKLGVVLTDNAETPALLVAPEAGWATVNVGALREKAVDANILARRVRVEILRAFGLIAGAAFMGRDQIVLRGDILTPSDLDMVLREQYGIESGAAIERGLPAFGIQPWRIVPYRVACEEGWAPAPTNDVQKAVWDKVHSIPKSPMKIEFDPKKGR